MGLGSKAVSILSIVCLPLVATPIAADSKTDFDTINQQKAATSADPQKDVYDQLSRSLDAWNRHDIDGFLESFWHSDDLLVVVDGESVRGWDLLSKAYHTGYPNPDEMCKLTIDRAQVQMLAPDLGFVLAWYTAVFPKKKEFGTSTIILRKFSEGWRIIISHTSFVEP